VLPHPITAPGIVRISMGRSRIVEHTSDHVLIAHCDDPEQLDAAVDTVMDATTKDEVLQHIR